MIEVKHLFKRYGNNLAVSDLSFTIEKGRIYGFLGPNGAGKSTTMNIMTGCLAATGGQVLIGGYDIFEQAHEAKKLIGYLPEHPPVYLDRTPTEYLTFVGNAKGLKGKKLKDEIQRVMEVTMITHMKDRLIGHLSKGYRQRVGIAQAILGDPEVIILDEPTVGLDPMQIKEIRNVITELGKDHTVILSSHILSEVQAVCETIMIINGGKLIAMDTPENLEKQFAGDTVIELTAQAGEETVRELLSQVEGVDVQSIKQEEDLCYAQLGMTTEDEQAVCLNISKVFMAQQIPVLKLNPAHATLEDVFIRLTAEASINQNKEVR